MVKMICGVSADDARKLSRNNSNDEAKMIAMEAGHLAATGGVVIIDEARIRGHSSLEKVQAILYRDGIYELSISRAGILRRRRLLTVVNTLFRCSNDKCKVIKVPCSGAV